MPDNVWLFAAGGFVAGALVATGAIWWRWRHRLHRAAAAVETWLERRLPLCIVVALAVIATFMGSAAMADNAPCRGGDCSGRGGDCRDTQGPCSDDDLNGNRVIVCLPESHCTFGGPDGT